MATTDFETWINELDLSYYDDIDSLYQTVYNCEDYGCYSIALAKGSTDRWIVSSDDCEESLLLASDKARRAFLNYIEAHFCDGLDEHAWYEFMRESEKDD